MGTLLQPQLCTVSQVFLQLVVAKKKYKHSEITHLQAEHLPSLERLESALDLDPVLVLGPLMAQLPVLLLPMQLELELVGLRLQRRLLQQE